MKKQILLTFLILISVYAVGQENITVSGYIYRFTEWRITHRSYCFGERNHTGTTSNVYGFYSLSLTEGEYEIDYRYIGFGTITQSINFNKDQTIDCLYAKRGVVDRQQWS